MRKTPTLVRPSPFQSTWVKVAIDAWTSAAALSEGHVLRPVNRGDQLQGEHRIAAHSAERVAGPN